MRRKLTCCCRGGKVALAIHNCRKPVIAAINGSAVGVGITMTLPCAIRVTSASSRIGFVFARRGIVMEACSSYFLPKLIGYSRAMHLVSTGAVYPATSKLFDGLFCEVLDRTEDVLPRALEFASDISKNVSTVSWTLMRDLIWRVKIVPRRHICLTRKFSGHYLGARTMRKGSRVSWRRDRRSMRARWREMRRMPGHGGMLLM